MSPRGKNIHQLRTRLDRLWSDYVVARDRAAASQDVKDGIIAGRAYATFVHEFLSPEDRQLMESPVDRSKSSRRAF